MKYVNGVMFMNTEEYSKAVMMSFSEAIELCETLGCSLKTSAYRKGYIPRNKSEDAINALVAPYHGRYGVGYTIHTEEPASTNYHRVYYYTA